MDSVTEKKDARNRSFVYFWTNRYLYLLLVPCVVYFIVFNYVPMYGLVIAFKDFRFSRGIMGSPWVGLDNFRHLFGLADFYRVFGNSLMLSFLRLVICFPIPIILSLAINEIPFLKYKRAAQTMVYLPYFISWVVIGGILVNLLSPSWGIINLVIRNFGGEPIFFLGSSSYFRGIALVSHVWKNAGWETIIYLAAITSINQELYEAATIDGASRLQRIRYVTLPGIKPTIIILLLLAIGHLMNNGFEQIFVIQNNSNLQVSEVFETYTYRLGLVNGRFSFAATVGMFSSSVGFILLLTANKIAKLLGEEGIF
ncbi:MAG: ABC transporter permease subunit [Defluviitaleaceae bacterium]|nr:ABC transporter permease subunit [Defluviitaleaceae bacterium]MCL2836567.1 ABC transporter permease subunit [Defluviitaleaceae bacterium]